MRIAFDVAPLSHPRTGVGNYVLGSLRGLVEAGADEVVAVRAHLRARAAGDPRGARRAAVEPRLRCRCRSRTSGARAGAALGWPPVERFLGPVDVLHFSDWMYPPQRGGVRSTMVHDLVPVRFPEWAQRRTRRMHGAKYRNAARTCDVVFVNSEFTTGDVVELTSASRASGRRRVPRGRRRFRADGERADLGRPYVLTVATLEPRKNLETLLAARLLAGTTRSRSSARRVGEQPRARPART